MIFFGQILSGMSFKAYYAGLSLINIIIAVGLLYRRRWSYIFFILSTIWCVLIALVNICITTNDTLVKAGLKLPVNITKYRVNQGIAVMVAALMVYWLSRYRRQFSAGRPRGT